MEKFTYNTESDNLLFALFGDNLTMEEAKQKLENTFMKAMYKIINDEELSDLERYVIVTQWAIIFDKDARGGFITIINCLLPNVVVSSTTELIQYLADTSTPTTLHYLVSDIVDEMESMLQQIKQEKETEK